MPPPIPPSTPLFTSHRALLVHRYQLFQSALSTGEIQPFLYPQDTLPAFLLILTLLFLPKSRLPKSAKRSVSWLMVFVILGWEVWIIRNCRSLGVGNGYGIGLMGVWGGIWSFRVLLGNIEGWKRVEWRDGKVKEEGEATDGESRENNGTATTTSSSLSPSSESILVKRSTTTYGVTGTSTTISTPEKPTSSSSKPTTLVWQSYPISPFTHRLDWVLDLISTFRGPHWSWRIPGMPDPPTNTSTSSNAKSTLKSAQKPSSSSDTSSPQLPPLPISTASPEIARLIRKTALKEFLFWYFVIDFLKTTLIQDPYFWGLGTLYMPPPFSYTHYLPLPPPLQLPTSITTSPIFLKSTRLLLSLLSISSMLTLIFSLSPLFFAVLLPSLGWDRRLTRAPWREPFSYPPFWGPGMSVLDQGIAGWWGKWWHQMFRRGMGDVSQILVGDLGKKLGKRGELLVGLLGVFGLSGLIHSGAAYTTFSPVGVGLGTGTRFRDPLLFFLLQGGAIAVERSLFKRRPEGLGGWERGLRRVGTLLYILPWAYWTGPFLVDDFAKSGIWLFEPIPFSLFRGLGLGAEGEGWWCWGGKWVGWWDGSVQVGGGGGGGWGFRRGYAIL